MSCAVHHTFAGPPDAPVVVLSNSLGTTLEMWEPQVGVLARERSGRQEAGEDDVMQFFTHG